MQATATRIADVLAKAQETRRQWEAITEPGRRAAIAADHELRRRHPDQVLEPLRWAESEGAAQDAQESAQDLESRPQGSTGLERQARIVRHQGNLPERQTGAGCA